MKRSLVALLDVPSKDDFGDKDQAQIKSWLLISIKHPGFHAYLKARDRGIVQTMIPMDIESPSEKRAYYELGGRRLELVRLLNRAIKLLEIEDREQQARSKLEAQKAMRERK